MALAFLVNIPFLFNNLHVIYFISQEDCFPENPWDWKPCRETVRNDEESRDSRQNRESWQACVSHELAGANESEKFPKNYFFI